MIDREIEIRDEGGIVAIYDDNAEITHRLWGDMTEDNRFVALAEVIDFSTCETGGDSTRESDDSTEYESGARHFCEHVDIPDDVEQALIEYCGLDSVDDIVLRREVY